MSDGSMGAFFEKTCVPFVEMENCGIKVALRMMTWVNNRNP